MRKTSHHRHEDFNGNPMLVELPKEGYENTGEGGLAFYFIVPKLKNGDRCVCIPGGGTSWGYPDVVIYPSKYKSYPEYDKRDEYVPMPIDAGLLIGSTGLSLWNDFKGEYFHATFSSLTNEGKALYTQLKKMYGKVDIVTLLDT
jgi:hypothetical protein